MLRKNLDHIATLLHEAGVVRWAISPGSRNAPIVAGLIRHGGFELHSFPDERCAAFAALGMAQATRYPCGVICTSGTAVLNLYPAICEAYYQRIPLVAITADRPEELIDQWDGQTIHQKNIFEKHVLQSFETSQHLEKEDTKNALEKMIYAAVEKSISPVSGPVHINIPLRDPIYADLDKPFYATTVSRPFLFLREPLKPADAGYLQAEMRKYQNILVVAGQQLPDPHLQYELLKVSKRIPVIGDITSNMQHAALDGWELALHNQPASEALQPDLLITFGLSVVSKKLKQFLQKYQPKNHWHLSTGGFTGDPFQTNPDTKIIDAADFFAVVAEFENIGDENYLNNWQNFCKNGRHQKNIPALNQTSRQKEFEIVQTILGNSDHTVCLQLGNSMVVRYASMAGKTDAEIYCNRGTSGIDGTLSTAVGFALANTDKKVLCVIGDISFFYDSNAFWTDTLPQNLHIILLNNGGGKIFDFIDGPNTEKRLHPYIQTPHKHSAEHIAAHFDIPYFRLDTEEFENKLFELLQKNHTTIIELNTENG